MTVFLFNSVSDFFSESDLAKFTNCFAFVTNNQELKFSCLLVEYYYRLELVKFETKITSPSSSIGFPLDLSEKTILEILLAILKEFEIASYKEYYSKGTDGLMKEAMWQHHFFHACWKVFPRMIHPEVGACFGTRGSMDFYLDSTMQLGFEILREGNKIQQHIARFSEELSPGYQPISMKDHLVVDFQTKMNLTTDVLEPNYVRVNVSKDYSNAEVFYFGGHEIITFKN